MNYQIVCTRQGCEYVYYGETARNGFARGKEHLKGMEKKDEESVLVQHVKEWHQSDFATPPCH